MKIVLILLFLANALFLVAFGGFFENEPPKAPEKVDSRLKIIAQKDLPADSILNPDRPVEPSKATGERELKFEGAPGETPESLLEAVLKSLELSKSTESDEDRIAAQLNKIARETAAQKKAAEKNAENADEKTEEKTLITSLLLPNSSCVIWANLGNEEALSVQKLLVQRFSHIPTTVTSKSESSGKWRIFIPPFADIQAANERAQGLKALGLDYFVLMSGENKNAISLGLFSQEAAARAYFEDLQRKGVKDAVLQFNASSGISMGAITDVRVDVKDAKERARLVAAVKRIVPHKDARSCR